MFVLFFFFFRFFEIENGGTVHKEEAKLWCHQESTESEMEDIKGRGGDMKPIFALKLLFGLILKRKKKITEKNTMLRI